MEKAGATALFEEGKGSNSIGVVVNPVRLSSLRDFGTPEFVADKLIQAERRKVLSLSQLFYGFSVVSPSFKLTVKFQVGLSNNFVNQCSLTC